MITNDIDKWLERKGAKFLKYIGIRKNQFVLDFGCGHGTYTIPAALVVGKGGMVYGVDNNKDHLDELIQRVAEYGLENIQRIYVKNEDKLPLNDESIDSVLLYDVLHLVESRGGLLAELFRVLKHQGLLSVYPKHHKEDMQMDLDQVINEIESSGFSFENKLFNLLMHDDCLEQGYVLNFKKLR